MVEQRPMSLLLISGVGCPFRSYLGRPYCMSLHVGMRNVMAIVLLGLVLAGCVSSGGDGRNWSGVSVGVNGSMKQMSPEMLQ